MKNTYITYYIPVVSIPVHINLKVKVIYFNDINVHNKKIQVTVLGTKMLTTQQTSHKPTSLYT